MIRWLQIVWNLLLPIFQVVVLSIIQVFGFVTAAYLIGAINTNPTTNHQVTKQTENQRLPESELESRRAGSSVAESSTAKQLRMFGLLVLACLLNSIAMVCWLRQTSFAGFQLMAGAFVVFFMCMTVMPQSDTILFLRNPETIVRSAAKLGLVVSVFFAVGALPVFWRWHRIEPRKPKRYLSTISKTGFVCRLVVCVLFYVVVYVVFGYFVAWQHPDLRVFYGGETNLLGFWERITTPPTSNRVIPFQFARGLVWTFLCLGMIRYSNGARIPVAVSIALVIAIVMNSQLLLPNPIMSESIRYIHLLETATSNFVFGLVCVWLWTAPDLEANSPPRNFR